MLESKRKISIRILFVYLIISVSGCAANKFSSTDFQDPYENLNRKIFVFNMTFDRVIVCPIAKAYDVIFPWPIKLGVRNVFSNIGDVTSAANEVLQMNFVQVATDLSRIIINTTIGIGGVFDVASKIGLEGNKKDFGLTLAAWGSKNSSYIILPFLGPSTVRDAMGLPIDYWLFSIWPYVKCDVIHHGMLATKAVSNRTSLLHGDSVIEQAFDSYVFVRDVYLQRRNYLIKKSAKSDNENYMR
jgi:phospholipid-binding lipoprotein MlaA